MGRYVNHRECCMDTWLTNGVDVPSRSHSNANLAKQGEDEAANTACERFQDAYTGCWGL